MAAIQFPPINPGDAEPVDGDTYLYVPTQEEYVCTRTNPTDVPQWTQKGVMNSGSFAYMGLVSLTSAAPNALTGFIYSSQSAVNAADIDSSWVGLSGSFDVTQYQLVIFENPNWVLINTAADTSPWIRTSGGELQPAVSTDNLNMSDGNYLINALDDLP